jgi:hypothetical protein
MWALSEAEHMLWSHQCLVSEQKAFFRTVDNPGLRGVVTVYLDAAMEAKFVRLDGQRSMERSMEQTLPSPDEKLHLEAMSRRLEGFTYRRK